MSVEVTRMVKQSRTGVPVQIYLDPALRDRIQAIADTNGRAFAVEVRRALERYAAAPDRVVAPEPEPPPPKKPRGRPKKQKE